MRQIRGSISFFYVIYSISASSSTFVLNSYYSAQIGLMYLSEYGFAALPEYWTNVLGYNSTNGYNLSYGKDWMLTTVDEWTISRNSDTTYIAFYIIFIDGSSRNVRFGSVNGSYISDGVGVPPGFCFLIRRQDNKCYR